MQISNIDYLPDDSKIERSAQEWAKAAILLGLAAYFAFIIISGKLPNYINERFSWLSYVAVVIFAALGAATVYGIGREKAAGYGGHQRITWGMIAIVAIPLVMGTFIPSKPLGAEAVNGNISLSVASASSASAVSKDPASRNILDWMRVFSQSVTPSTFDGQMAGLVGFVYREPGFPENTFMIARFTVSCCVADAGAIGLPVYTEDAAAFPDGEWVQVAGTFQAGTFRDEQMPILHAETIMIVEQPEHPYLYP